MNSSSCRNESSIIQIVIIDMEPLEKELALLKGYVATLEHENDARNNEKNTLFSEIDRLTEENNHLNDLLSRSKPAPTINSSSSQQKEIETLKKTNSSLAVEISNLKSTVTVLTSENSTLKNRRVNETVSTNSSSEVEALKTKVALLSQEYSRKEEDARKLTQEKDNFYRQLTTAKNQLTTKSSELITINSNLKRLENENVRLEKETRELKQSSKSSTQFSTLVNTKLTLEASMRQLTSKIQWVEATNKSLERQKVDLGKRISQLEKELYQSKGRVTQLKFNQDSYKNVESSLKIKDKEMQALEHMIATLKENKKHLQQAVKEKQDVIVSLQSQVYTFRASVHDYSDLERELNQLNKNRANYERQISTLTKSNQECNMQILALKREINNQATELYQLRQEKQQFLQQKTSLLEMQKNKEDEYNSRMRDQNQYVVYRSMSPQRVPSRDSNSGEDLRVMVERLKLEVEGLKNSSMSQSELFRQCPEPQRGAPYFNEKSLLVVNDRSQVRDNMKRSHSRIIVEKDKQVANKSKWQNLQRKINALRNENESLKKSLFD